MNTSLRFPVIALAAAVTLATMLAPPARAADCNSPQGTGVQRACAKADEGPTELRRFVERTQPIYGLSAYDFHAAEPGASHEALGDEYAEMPTVASK